MTWMVFWMQRTSRSLKGRLEAMHEYLRHTGSSLWAVPPGVRPGGRWGDTLLA